MWKASRLPALKAPSRGRRRSRPLNAPPPDRHSRSPRARVRRARARAALRVAEDRLGRLLGLARQRHRRLRRSGTATAPRPRACPPRSSTPRPCRARRGRLAGAAERSPPTRDTQISFLGVPAAQIREVSAVGARSGTHAGRLRAYSQGDGASFVPDEPFDSRRARAAFARAVGAGAARHAGSPSTFRVDTPYPTAARLGLPQPAGGARRLPELLHAARACRRRS